jgi:hypothetical protein
MSMFEFEFGTFLGLGFKTKWASISPLRHKTDGGRSA